MKILHVLSQRPDSTGSGIFVQAILRAARAAGHRTRLLAGVQAGQEPDATGLPVEALDLVRFGGTDLPFPIVGMSDVMPYASSRFGDLSADRIDRYEEVFAAALQRAVEEFRPDLVHSHHLWLLSSLTRRLVPDLPLVTNCHGSDLRQFRSCPHLRARVLEGCRGIDRVLVLGEAMRREVGELYGLPAGRIEVVGAGFDRKLFHPGPRPAPDPVRLVYAGKLSRAKGVPWLLRALGALADRDWELHLVGSGAGEQKDECLALAAGLGDRVVVHGAVPQAELAGILRAAHLFVLPSFFEGLPLVVVEALACGCRVVVTDLPGIAELLAGRDPAAVRRVPLPRLVDSDVPVAADEAAFERALGEALAGQMAAIRNDPAGGTDGIVSLLRECSWEAVTERIEAAYKRTVAG